MANHPHTPTWLWTAAIAACNGGFCLVILAVWYGPSSRPAQCGPSGLLSAEHPIVPPVAVTQASGAVRA